MHFVKNKISKIIKTYFSQNALRYFLSHLGRVASCRYKRLEISFSISISSTSLLIRIFSQFQGPICYKYYLTFYQMMFVMVHGYPGVNAMYPAVEIQGSDNAYAVRRRIVQKRKYSRQKLVLLMSVQQMEVLNSTLNGKVFLRYLGHQHLIKSFH